MTDALAILDAIDRERGDSSIGMIQANQVRRLRDEIVALRRRCALHDDLEFVSKNELTQARDDALEEAARVVEDHFNPETSGECAAAIRALKEKGVA